MRKVFIILILLCNSIAPVASHGAESPPDWDLTFGTTTSSLSFFEAGLFDDNWFSIGGAVGKFINSQVEPVLGVDLFFFNQGSESHLSCTLHPGIAYNFSENPENSWVVHIAASINSKIYSTKLDENSLSFLGGFMTFGKRIPLTHQMSWYPRAFAQYSKDGRGPAGYPPSKIAFGVIPLSISVLF